MIKRNKRLIKICINKDATIFQAIENLSINQIGIVLVVEDGKLLGTITDGDIRRGILKYNDMNIFVDKIMRKKPKFLRSRACQRVSYERHVIKRRKGITTK
mgnify:CR=1 FL=1